MSQPPAYSRAFSFTNFAAAFPSLSLPGNQVDLELNNVKATLDAALANLALIQRDDGGVKNASVGYDQLKTEVVLGFNAPSVWVTGTAYAANSSTVFNGSGFYRCLVAHTSGVFATDLAAAKWQLIVNLAAVPLVSANQIAVTPSGSLTTDVQGSLQALDTGKAPLSHTQVASTISDSTAAGRAMLTAADVAAQKALLSLGSLAFLNTLNVSQIPANLAFLNPISGALIANANDWTPTGWATAAVVRVAPTSAISITGFAATSDGDIKIIYNTSAFVVTVPFESASSIAANRIAGPALPLAITIPPGNGVPFIYDSVASRWRVLSPKVVTPAPTVQRFTSGSGTYTTPANVAWIRIRMVGAGSGGGGGNNSSAATAGGASTFSGGTLSAGGGAAGASSVSAAIVGGAASGGNIANIPGGSGQGAGGASGGPGGTGGSTAFGGGGAGGVGGVGAALAGATNSGAGGGGGGGGATSAIGAGGAGGGYVEHVINGPAATYTYAVGAGSAGIAGTSAGNGGAGAAGLIIVEEYY